MEYNAGIIIRLTSNAIMNDLYENEGKAIYIYMNKIKDWINSKMDFCKDSKIEYDVKQGK